MVDADHPRPARWILDEDEQRVAVVQLPAGENRSG